VKKKQQNMITTLTMLISMITLIVKTTTTTIITNQNALNGVTLKGPFTHTLHWAALRCVALVLVELVETEKCFY